MVWMRRRVCTFVVHIQQNQVFSLQGPSDSILCTSSSGSVETGESRCTDFSEYLIVFNVTSIIQLFCHCIPTWYAMSRPLVKLLYQNLMNWLKYTITVNVLKF